jgi:predicted dithiol-disulfide oxidoreductase (DUF899 family)
MVRVDKPYTFEGPDGPASLLDRFAGRPQLVLPLHVGGSSMRLPDEYDAT